MSYLARALDELAQQPGMNAQSITHEALETYLAIAPQVRHSIRNFATTHRINFSTAVAEACRSYFMPE